MASSSRNLGLHGVFAVFALFGGAAGCGEPVPDGAAYAEHDEPLDLIPAEDGKSDGVAAQFDKNRVVSDEFFNDGDAVSAAAVQAFFERTPYNRPSFLANERVGGRPVSEVLVEISEEYELNPVMLLARMQVEKGLVGKSSRPGGNSVDFAMGCGCPDNRSCNEAFRGLDKQLECAADTLRKHYNSSESGSGIWNKGVRKSSLDPTSVTPANHATASLYAYTPWVLVGQGGNWLVWNVTKRYVNHFADSGDLGETSNDFVGSPCDPDDDESCDFSSDGNDGFCVPLPPDPDADDDDDDAPKGYCSLSCEGLCPDRGSVTTFCVELSDDKGHCVPQSDRNDGCEDFEGTIEVDMERFVGDTNISVRNKPVCVPREAPEEDDDDEMEGDEPQDGDVGASICENNCETGETIPNGDETCFCDQACVGLGDCCPGYEEACMPE